MFTQISSLSHLTCLLSLPSKKTYTQKLKYLSVIDDSLKGLKEWNKKINNEFWDGNGLIVKKGQGITKDELLHKLTKWEGIIDLETHGYWKDPTYNQPLDPSSQSYLGNDMGSILPFIKFQFYTPEDKLDYITLKDLSKIKNFQFELAVLAFCHGGDTKIMSNGQMISWVEMLLQNGGRAVISRPGLTVGYNEAKFDSIFFEKFYGLLLSGESKDIASHLAHIEVLKIVRTNYPDKLDPFNWCWSLWGSTQKLLET